MSAIDLIKREEGFRAEPYRDGNGHWTRGYGEKIPGVTKETTRDELPAKYLHTTREEAEARAIQMIDGHRENVIGAVGRSTWNTLSPELKDVYISLSYQIGKKGFRGFKNMIAATQAGDMRRARLEYLDSKFAKQDSPARALRGAEAFGTANFISDIKPPAEARPADTQGGTMSGDGYMDSVYDPARVQEILKAQPMSYASDAADKVAELYYDLDNLAEGGLVSAYKNGGLVDSLQKKIRANSPRRKKERGFAREEARRKVAGERPLSEVQAENMDSLKGLVRDFSPMGDVDAFREVPQNIRDAANAESWWGTAGHSALAGLGALGALLGPIGDASRGLVRKLLKKGIKVDLPNVKEPNEIISKIDVNKIEHGESAMPGGKLDDTAKADIIVKEYADAGTEFPPISVMRTDDGKWMVVDGSHRLEAARVRGDDTIPVYVDRNEAVDAGLVPKQSPPLKGLLKTKALRKRFDPPSEVVPRNIDPRTQSVESRISNLTQLKKEKEKFNNVDWNRLKELGFTSDLNESGYINPNGMLVDMSGKVEGGSPGMRSLDHREISSSGSAGMMELISQGHIRMDGTVGSMDISKMPTNKQFDQIENLTNKHNGKVFIDLDDGLGEPMKSRIPGEEGSISGYYPAERRFNRSYPEGTSAQRIINDIKKFFDGGEPNPLFHRFAHGGLVSALKSRLAA
jgi:GH24 family phage-related lysozyme (muramidase)